MRIPCPYCGERDVREFSYLGDANVVRPATDDAPSFHEYVNLRDNKAGLNREYWYHASGCRSWLVVIRDTRTHRIDGAELAR